MLWGFRAEAARTHQAVVVGAVTTIVSDIPIALLLQHSCLLLLLLLGSMPCHVLPSHPPGAPNCVGQAFDSRPRLTCLISNLCAPFNSACAPPHVMIDFDFERHPPSPPCVRAAFSDDASLAGRALPAARPLVLIRYARTSAALLALHPSFAVDVRVQFSTGPAALHRHRIMLSASAAIVHVAMWPGLVAIRIFNNSLKPHPFLTRYILKPLWPSVWPYNPPTTTIVLGATRLAPLSTDPYVSFFTHECKAVNKTTILGANGSFASQFSWTKAEI